jgi:hypothetical protein
MEVNASALRRNLARLRAHVGEGVGVLPLVKANAYGVGLERAMRGPLAVAPAARRSRTAPGRSDKRPQRPRSRTAPDPDLRGPEGIILGLNQEL